MFLGTYEHNLDDKLRLTIPSKLRNKLGQVVYVSKGFEGCLELRTHDDFQTWFQELTTHSNANSSARLLAREIFANSSEIEVDNSGRIKIPANLLGIAKIEKAVLFLGLGNKIEIWDPVQYDAYCTSNESHFEEVANQLGGAR